jgi:hypothetical protein
MFERSLTGFPKEEVSASERYLATKGVLNGNAEFVGVFGGFYGCTRCLSCHLAQNWHERTMCGKDRVLTVINTFAGKQCGGFVPTVLEKEWNDSWREE